MAVALVDGAEENEAIEPGTSITLHGDVAKRLFGDKLPELESEFVADTAWRVTLIAVDPPMVQLQLIAIAPETDSDNDLNYYGKDGPKNTPGWEE